MSSWENGVSEPEDQTKLTVNEVLPLPYEVVPSALGLLEHYDGPLLSELPFEDLGPGAFEDFAVTLAGYLFPDAQVYRQGASGHTQHGFDVVVERDGKVLAAIQCKRVKEFGRKDIDKAVAGATLSAESKYIFLSRSASPDARAALHTHTGWQLWDKSKLSHEVHGLELYQSVPLVDRYFPLLREKFLGVRLPGPWLEPAGYFGSVGRSERATHKWPLVGRAALLADLTQFVAESVGRVGVLVGRGGTGKTKVLHDLCECLPRQTSVRFLERDADIDERAFEQLPSSHLLVVLDDAHDEGAPVGKVVQGVLDTNHQAVVLLALRPDGEARSRRQLREAGIDPDDVRRWELRDLELQEAESLAREILGPEKEYAALRLASATRDCPYLLVTGGIMIRDEAVEISRLEGDDRVRRELIESIANTTTSGAGDQLEIRQEILRAVAAFQPLRTKDKDFREALESLAGRAFDQVMPHLSAWEEAGILLRRNDTYRVVPDLLGDALLARAASAPETGTPTDYLDRARRQARGDALANLMVNASRVDWQEPPQRRGQLVSTLWRAVQEELWSSDAAYRVALLEVLAKVAFYQPRPSLNMVRWMLGNPAQSAPVDAGWGFSYTYTEQDVRDAATPVLRTAAYDPDALPEAAELLWEIGRSDSRPANQEPNHALRKFEEIARFDRRGVTVYQRTLPGIVERWMLRPRRDTDAHDPLTVLLPLLAAEDHQEIWSSHALTFRPFFLDPTSIPVEELRGRVLDMAFEQLHSSSQHRAVAAAQTIGASLNGPHGGFGLQVTADLKSLWVPHFKRTLARLQMAVSADPPAPVVAVVLREMLQWPAEHPASDIHQASLDVLSALPRGPEHELARALHGGPIDAPVQADTFADYVDRQRADREFMSKCVESLGSWQEDHLISTAERLLDELRGILADDDSRPRPFMSTMVESRPDLGEAICDQVAKVTESRLAPLVGITLSTLAQMGHPETISLAWRLLGTDDVGLARQVGYAFGFQRGRKNIIPNELPLLHALLAYSDPEGIVSDAAVGAVRYLSEKHQDLAVDLLTREPGQWSRTRIDEFALAFSPQGKLSWNSLAQRHKDTFLNSLRSAGSIESYPVMALLSMLSLQEPYSVIELLTARVEASEMANLTAYVPVPQHWQAGLCFRERVDFPDILRRVREWLAIAADSPLRRELGSQLFGAVAGQFDPQVRQVIEEYLHEPDPAKIRTVSTILRGAPPNIVWETELVIACLRAADICGPESLSAVQNSLYRATFNGGRGGFVGKAFPQDVEQRDTAARLAAEAVGGSVEEQFYRALSQSAQIWIDRSLSIEDLPADNREW